MSRSYKKNAIVKDGYKGAKSKANRRLRRAVKVAVNTDKEILPVSPELTNPYDICDWKFMSYKGDRWYIKFKRK